jgi:hypothetical protein
VTALSASEVRARDAMSDTSSLKIGSRMQVWL